MSLTNRTINGIPVPEHICDDNCRRTGWIHLSAEQLCTMSPLRRDEYHIMYGIHVMSEAASELVQHLCAEIKQLNEEAERHDERMDRAEEKIEQMKEMMDSICAKLNLSIDDEDGEGENLEERGSEGGI